MADYTDEITESELEKLKKKINKVYGEAANDIDKMIEEFFFGRDIKQDDGTVKHYAGFYEKDAEMKKKLENGELKPTGISASMTPEEYYKQWRANQIGRSDRFAAMRDQVAQRMTNANETAVRYMNDSSVNVYTESRNYAAYTIESTGANINFALMNENAVREALKEGYRTMPYYDETFPMAQKRLLTNKDIAYGQATITKTVTSALITGKSVKAIADELQSKIVGMNRTSALRASRTALGAAQNAGHQAAYQAAADKGIAGEKQWDAVVDSRTRDSHKELNGVTVDVKEEFPNGLMFPKDPDGEPAETYNCRCRIIYVTSRIKDDFESDNTVDTYVEKYSETERVQKYQQWKADKQQQTQQTQKVNSQLTTTTQNSVNIRNKVSDGNTQVLDQLGVKWNEPKKQTTVSDFKTIVGKIAGGDLTKGSCASAAITYIGQKIGYDVLDFRDGESRHFFSSSFHLREIFSAQGMNTIRAEGASSLTVGNRLLQKCEIGHEYYLCVGRHAAIVRKIEEDNINPTTGEVIGKKNTFQYLELQSSTENGWKDFNSNARYTLKTRFGCSTQSSSSSYYDFMTDLNSDFDNDTFWSYLGYINTPENEQKKGKNGRIR